jgi:hypothetical protein
MNNSPHDIRVEAVGVSGYAYETSVSKIKRELLGFNWQLFYEIIHGYDKNAYENLCCE